MLLDMDATSLAHRIDHSLLTAQAGRPAVHKLVAEAIEYGFASVCVNGVFIADVAKALYESGVKTCATVGFPLGAGKATIKAIEATSSVKDGADEIDFVSHLPYLLKGDVDAARNEMREVVRAARGTRPDVGIKAIIETALLMSDVSADQGEARIEAACRAVRESGCDFVKTSTGFHPAGGATIEAVKYLKKHSGGLLVKAAGGIRTRETALAMIEAGADRIGCSASVAILKQG